MVLSFLTEDLPEALSEVAHASHGEEQEQRAARELQDDGDEDGGRRNAVVGRVLEELHQLKDHVGGQEQREGQPRLEYTLPFVPHRQPAPQGPAAGRDQDKECAQQRGRVAGQQQALQDDERQGDQQVQLHMIGRANTLEKRC